MEFNNKLETKRLILRKICRDDVNSLYNIKANAEIFRRLTWKPVNDIIEINNYIEETLKLYEANLPGCYGIELKENGSLIGIVDLVKYNDNSHSLQFRYILLPEHHNKGIMTEALIKIISHIFKQTNINRIEASCLAGNKASAKVLEKAGMHLEGIMRDKIFLKGEYVDLKFFSILKSDIQYI